MGDGDLRQCVIMVVIEFGIRGGVIGEGFQCDSIEVKDGPDIVGKDEIDVGSELQDMFMVKEEVVESENSEQFWLRSVFSFLFTFWLTAFSRFLIFVSSLFLFILRKDCSSFKVLSVSRVVSRLRLRLWISFSKLLPPFSRDLMTAFACLISCR